MWIVNIALILLLSINVVKSDETEEPILYYYGLEESERGLGECAPRQACGALVRRAWRAPALVRLCRCPRRPRRPRRRAPACDAPLPQHSRLHYSDRAYLQFCQPVDDWPQCSIEDAALVVETSHERMNPDEIEESHHRDVRLEPPVITYNCRCRYPNYWKPNTTADSGDAVAYRCAPLPLCRTGEYCGHVDYDLYQLYQSCLCPKHHMCVHGGGVANTDIAELLYRGRGWRAHCVRVREDYSYEDY